MPAPDHLNWLQECEAVTTDEGKQVVVYEFLHQPEAAVLSAWARHLRQHYCEDGMLDMLRSGTGLTRAQYLTNMLFPSATQKPGPSVRAGDFAEILVADFLEYVLNHWVPRWRYLDKATPNDSVKGTDVIGLQIAKDGIAAHDTLTTFEIKAKLTDGFATKPRLQHAVDDAAKDSLRQAFTLNSMKRRAAEKGDGERVQMVERFQCKPDRPFREQIGAAAVLHDGAFDVDEIKATLTAVHGDDDLLLLLVIRGQDLMTLAHNLYELAANEA
ncbi:DUF1837 domain-containing protein [Cupriavidus basilensis]|uniref:Virulence associated protein n=1 Tax=Cupriavidus basilensis TaxID=68895 RepID=A0A643FIR2_9BURK|nr:DUF1837 domain-containing protein [Cupriavidus basilensis]QOT76337.1 virulence associated protein [Cupriavidus basilensis]